MGNELQFTVNALTKATQRTGPDGREYLVAPGVAIVAGVVGNEFVPPDEIAKAAFGFSGRPLPLYHPMQGNDYISANSPELESKLSVGKFWNAVFDGDKLRGEYWIDIAKAQSMGGEAVELLKRLQSNQQIETSTAYGRDFDPTPGTYNGKPYAGIARNLVPDHVAVLVNERGKCSIADGCGLLANSCNCGCDKQKADNMVANEGVVDEQVKTGIMVAFYLSPDDANTLAMSADELPQGSELIAPEQMHITLAYLGKTDETDANELSVMQQLAHFAKYSPVVRAQVGGIGLFNNESDGMQPLWAQVDSAFLVDWRNQMVGCLPCSVADNYSYTPHITLAYVPTGSDVALKTPQRQELIFDKVALSWGNKTTLFPLQGEAIPIDTANSMEDVNMSKDKEVQAAVEQPAAVPVANDKAPEKPTVAANSDDKTIAANAEQLVVVNAELSALKGQISEFATLINDLGGVEKVRDILQTTHANLQAMAANAKREKDMLINQLVGNARCAFRKVDLEKFDIEALSKLAMSLQPADYSARGFSANRMPEAEELVTLDELNKEAK